MLGGAFTRLLRERGWEFAAWDREELDITDAVAVEERITAWKPELVINCAAYNAVDKAPDEPNVAMAINGDAVGYIAQAALACGATMVHFSTDYVFDGTNTAGYTEDAAPSPVSVYGESKARGERALIEAVSHKPEAIRWYLIRTSRLFGEPGTSEGSKKSFPAMMIAFGKEKGKLRAIDAEVSSPTFVDDLAAATLAIIEEKKPSGVYHRTNDGSCTWYEYSKAAIEAVGLNIPIEPVGPDAFPRQAKRPANSVLISTKLQPLRSWQNALRAFLKT